ncbi:MAG: hypothetical protein HYS73_00575 [Parcubacteria group bacterium]|nr:hypothetical protein [Parcubacteria group bacterium]
MKKLHITQEKITQFLKSKKGIVEGVSLREIGECIGIGRQAQVVEYHLSQLEKQGFVRRNYSENGMKIVLLKTQTVPVAHIRLYSATAECGHDGLLAEDGIVGDVPLSTITFGIRDPDSFFLVKARGKSMEPHIKEGDLVLAHEQPTVDSGSIAVIAHDGMLKIKKILYGNPNKKATYSLISFNHEEPRQEVTEDTELRIVGLVKGIIRNREQSLGQK